MLRVLKLAPFVTVPRVIGGCPKSLLAMQLSRLAPQRPGTAPPHTATVPALLPSTLKRASFGRSPSAPRPAPARPTNGGLRPGVDQTSRSSRRSWNYFKYDLRKGQPPCFSKAPAPDCPKDTHRPLRARRWCPQSPRVRTCCKALFLIMIKLLRLTFDPMFAIASVNKTPFYF